MTRQPQLYDTISKGGKFWKIVDIQGDVIKAKRSHEGHWEKRGRPLILTLADLENGVYTFHDKLPPCTVTQQEPQPRRLPEVPYYEKTCPRVAREEKQPTKRYLCRLESGRLFYVSWELVDLSFRDYVMVNEWIVADDGASYRSSMIESICRIKE